MRPVFVAGLMAVLAARVLVVAGPPPSGGACNITLVTDNTPDLTDIDSYLSSITSQYSTPQEQAIAIWRWSQRLRKQTTNPKEDGHEVLDPIRMFNSYGYCNCGIVSGVNNALWRRMGWKAHYVQLGDHTVCECSWDDGKTWHMFDSSMSFYCFNDRGEVASVREIEKNPRFYLENYAPECGTNPVGGTNDHRGWRCASDHPVHFQRTLANGYDSFKPPNSISDYNLYAQWGHRYVLNLRPHEHYTRFYLPFENSGTRTFRPVRGDKDVDVDKTIRANGTWHYAPDLRDPATREWVYSESGVQWTPEGVKGPGQVVFKIAAANVVTSAKLTLGGAGFSVLISRDTGITWQQVTLREGAVECLEVVAGVTEFLVKVDLAGRDALLASLQIDTTTQLNRAALPRLARGANRVQLRLGRQVETIQFQPSIVSGNHKQTAWKEQGIDVNTDLGFYKPTLRPAEKGLPCFVTWKIDAPTPITEVTCGGTICVKSARDSVALLHSWDGQDFQLDYKKTNDAPPWDQMVNSVVAAVPPGTRSAFLRYEFQTAQSAKSYSGPGIQMAAMTVQHAPRVTNTAPIEVTFYWVEHRDEGTVERRHTEIVSSASREYVIHVGGFRDPTMKWVRVNVQGHGPDGVAAKPGYSDGQDVGPGAEPSWVRYRWGTNLALGWGYTLEGQQDERNPDGGRDLTDGIVAPPDTYVSAKYMPTYVMFARDVSPVVTLDLGSAQKVAAVRVHTGQEGGFHVSHPDAITVEVSADGKTFSKAGSAGFRQVFEPPADFVPWELDESSLFADLPAGGRLAWAYRILFEHPLAARYVRVRCDARKGWGMLVSEIQVFDAVKVEKGVPPLVQLPAL